MKSYFILCILLSSCLMACAFNPRQALVKSTYDKYSEMEITTVGPFDIDRALTWYLNKGVSNGKTAFTLQFLHNGALHNESSKWQYLQNHNLHLLIDGKSHFLGAGDHSGNVMNTTSGGAYVVEKMDYIIDEHLLQLISESTSISGRIGKTEFIVSPEQLSVLIPFAKNNTLSRKM